jgi:hypothetical protein
MGIWGLWRVHGCEAAKAQRAAARRVRLSRRLGARCRAHEALCSIAVAGPGIFRGVSIWVNGRTEPTAAQLREMWVGHVGSRGAEH